MMCRVTMMCRGTFMFILLFSFGVRRSKMDRKTSGHQGWNQLQLYFATTGACQVATASTGVSAVRKYQELVQEPQILASLGHGLGPSLRSASVLNSAEFWMLQLNNFRKGSPQQYICTYGYIWNMFRTLRQTMKTHEKRYQHMKSDTCFSEFTSESR